MTEAATTAATTAAATTTTAAATTTTAAAATTAAATTTAAPWHGIADPEAAAYVANKGWNSPADVVKSYQGAEKLIGRDPATLVTLPRADDPAGFRTLLGKLGLPETPDKYEFSPPPQGLTPDAGYEAWARGTFHKVGLLPDQVKALTAEHNNYVAGILQQQAKDYELAVTQDKAALLKEWGGGHERMMAAAKSAATALGFTAEMIEAIERTNGYAGTYKFFANLGQKMGEDGFVTGGDKNGGGGFGKTMTPAEAKVEIDAMKLDPVAKIALTDSQHPGHKAAKEKWNKLHSVAYPE